MIRTVALLYIISLLYSCESSATSDGNTAIPDIVAMDVHQISVSGNGRVEVHADTVETYNEDDYSVFYGANVIEKDADGETLLEGGANRIQVHGNNDGVAEGEVYIKDFKAQTTLSADLVEYEVEKRLLTGQGAIQIDLGDGLSIVGEILEADLSKRTYILTDAISGTIEFDANKND